MFRRRVSLSLLILMAIATSSIDSTAMAATGNIQGLVCDADTGQPLDHANLVVLGTTIGAISRNGGRFHIQNVPAGTYQLQASYVGYDPMTRPATVRAGETVVVSFCGGDQDAEAEGAQSKVMAPMPDPGTGQMWTLGEHRVQLPLRKTDVAVSVSGSMAQVTVEQTFENPSSESIEAVYVFPLSHRAAVHAMSMRIGERRLEAEIRKRQEARAVYAEARKQGRTAALLQQERPNVFTQQVANLTPGNDVVVRIEYSEELALDSGRYELVVPTVVGPRFIPGVPTPAVVLTSTAPLQGMGEKVSVRGTGYARNTDQVPDASRITPRALPPGEDGGHRLSIRVDLDAGVPLTDVASVNHAVSVQHAGVGQAQLVNKPADALANKDFVLRYRTRGDRAALGFMTHRSPNDAYGYFHLVLEPPERAPVAAHQPRELLLVLDVSGSMGGAPLETMKGVVRWLLMRLESQDSFNLVTFSNTAYAYAPGSLVASADNVQQALRFVGELRAGGGTQMIQGLSSAFALRGNAAGRHVLCMLTDGLVGNDRALLRLVQQQIGNDRLFAIGIGSSPNRFLVDGLAEEGLGAQDFVALDADPREVVERFFGRIDTPVLRDLQIDWGGLPVLDLQPASLPDLYHGQVLRLTGRYRVFGEGRVVVRGVCGNAPFEHSVRAVLPQRAPGHAALRNLWARTRIHELTRGNAEDAATEVEALGLQYAMMTDYTAFVVTDNQVVNDRGVPRLVPQPVEMPQGVRHEMIFGSRTFGMTKGVGGRTQRITITGDAKKVDVKSSAVRHVSGTTLTLPVESVQQSVALQAGSVALQPDQISQGGALHVRGGRSGSLPMRIRDPLHRLEVQVKPVDSKIKRGQPIQLRIQMKNTSGESVRLPKEYRLVDGTLLLQIVHEDKLVSMPPVETSDVPFADLLKPGEEREYLVSLTGADGVELEHRGRYEITILRLFGVWVPEDQRLLHVQLR